MDFDDEIVGCFLIVVFTAIIYVFAFFCALFSSILTYLFDVIDKKDPVFSDIYKNTWSEAGAGAENLLDGCYKVYLPAYLYLFRIPYLSKT